MKEKADKPEKKPVQFRVYASDLAEPLHEDDWKDVPEGESDDFTVVTLGALEEARYWALDGEAAKNGYLRSLASTESCLHGLSCPKCGNFTDLRIAATSVFKMTPDGDDGCGDVEWDDTSSCRCPDCGYNRWVCDFRAAKPVGGYVVYRHERHAYPVFVSDDEAGSEEEAIAIVRDGGGEDLPAGETFRDTTDSENWECEKV